MVGWSPKAPVGWGWWTRGSCRQNVLFNDGAAQQLPWDRRGPAADVLWPQSFPWGLPSALIQWRGLWWHQVCGNPTTITMGCISSQYKVSVYWKGKWFPLQFDEPPLLLHYSVVFTSLFSSFLLRDVWGLCPINGNIWTLNPWPCGIFGVIGIKKKKKEFIAFQPMDERNSRTSEPLIHQKTLWICILGEKNIPLKRSYNLYDKKAYVLSAVLFS